MPAARPIPFGDHLLLHRIGLGGTAEVFRAVRRGRRPGEPEVALKRMLPHLAEDPLLVRMFLREVEALDRIDHANVVRLLGHGIERGLPFLLMPLLDGASLRRLLRPHPEAPVQPLPIGVALWLTAQVALGLHAAHREGIVHRDVSPTNIQVTTEGQVLVLDFGIARVAGMAQTTHGGSLRGKWAYLSPEQIAGEPLDGRSDLFALGSVLVELLTGEPPFQGRDPQETMVRVSAGQWPGFLSLPGLPAVVVAPLEALLRQVLARHPGDRPQDGAQLAQALLDLLATLEPPQPWVQLLAERAQSVPGLALAAEWSAAELRGEQVTNPALDPDATQVLVENWQQGTELAPPARPEADAHERDAHRPDPADASLRPDREPHAMA